MAKRIAPPPNRTGSLLDRAARLSLQNLFLYVVIFAVCGVGLFVSLRMEGVGVSALSLGTAEEKRMLILGTTGIAASIVGAVFFIAAIGKKKRNESGRLSQK